MAQTAPPRTQARGGAGRCQRGRRLIPAACGLRAPLVPRLPAPPPGQAQPPAALPWEGGSQKEGSGRAAGAVPSPRVRTVRQGSAGGDHPLGGAQCPAGPDLSAQRFPEPSEDLGPTPVTQQGTGHSPGETWLSLGHRS